MKETEKQRNVKVISNSSAAKKISRLAGLYYRKRGRASYIVREVRSVREKERERERERERDTEREREIERRK